MALVIPVVAGPVNELMTRIHVLGTVPDATVVVNAAGNHPREVAKGQASGGDDWVDLLPGGQLAQGDYLTASQTLGAEASPPSPESLIVVVTRAPTVAELGYVGSTTHLYRCGTAVRVTGAFPGATVTAVWAGAEHGRAVAGNDDAQMTLDSGLALDTVHLAQSVPAGSGPETLLRVDQLPFTAKTVPAPGLQAPLVACQRAVAVTGVIDGATVTLTHADGTSATSTFVQSAEWFVVPSLREGDRVTARQDLTHCELRGDDSATVDVGPAVALPAPIVPQPLCEGAFSVRVGGLVPGALVRLHIGDTTYTGYAATAWVNFFVPQLTNGEVSATQELVGCGPPSAPSAPPVTIDTKGIPEQAVTIRGPLMACGRGVPVTGARIGALLTVYRENDTRIDDISGLVVAPATDFTIPVTPYLQQNDRVWVNQYACSATSTTSQTETVQPHANPGLPQVTQPVFADNAGVVLAGVIPGALVDVYTRPQDGDPMVLSGTTIADGATPYVPLDHHLRIDEQVAATQTICGTQTEPGPVARAIAPPPLTPAITEPAQGATNVALRPTFKWADPGGGTDRAAAHYELQVLDASTAVVGPTIVNGTSFTPTADMNYLRRLTVQVRAVNGSGASNWAQVVFTTQAAPVAAPVLTAFDPDKHTLTGHGFLPTHSVVVRLSMVGNYVTNFDGKNIPDTREGEETATSDPAGNVANVVVNPQSLLQVLNLQDSRGDFVSGAWHGEVMHFSATDSRANAADLTGVLWSNTLDVQAP